MADNGRPSEGNDENQDRKSKKKTRLQWDEENLTLNALEMERTPRMKIDEPNTPFAYGPASEAGSSTSGSAPGSPAPYFIPKERLRGFQALENEAVASGNVPRITRTVQILDDPAGAGTPPEPNEEFEARRRAHYEGEARLSRTVEREFGANEQDGAFEAPSRSVQIMDDGGANVTFEAPPARSVQIVDDGGANVTFEAPPVRSVQIVDERETVADEPAPEPNPDFAARRNQHYANEAVLMRAQWEEERERAELQPEAPNVVESPYNAPDDGDTMDATGARDGYSSEEHDVSMDLGSVPNGVNGNRTPNGRH